MVFLRTIFFSCFAKSFSELKTIYKKDKIKSLRLYIKLKFKALH